MLLSIIDKYIIKKFLGTFFFSIALIISVSVVFDINEKIDRFINNNAPVEAIILDYYINFVPYYANLFSPLFVFISVIFFTSKLADNSEIIAILSNGMSFRRLMRPYMISAAVISIASFALNSFIIPPANKTRIDFQNKYVRDKSVSFATHIQLQVSDGVILYISRFDNKVNEGYNLALDSFENKELKSRLVATRIEHDSAHVWKLYNYSIRHFDGMRETITTGTSIDTVINVTPTDFLIGENDFELMTTPQLYRYIEEQKNRGMASMGDVSLKSFEIEYHKRFASIFSAFILTIIGASLSARKVKGGMGLNLVIGFALSFSYILFLPISSSFAVSGVLSPTAAAWLPNIIFMIIAAFIYRRAPN